MPPPDGSRTQDWSAAVDCCPRSNMFDSILCPPWSKIVTKTGSAGKTLYQPNNNNIGDSKYLKSRIAKQSYPVTSTVKVPVKTQPQSIAGDMGNLYGVASDTAAESASECNGSKSPTDSRGNGQPSPTASHTSQSFSFHIPGIVAFRNWRLNNLEQHPHHAARMQHSKARRKDRDSCQPSQEEPKLYLQEALLERKIGDTDLRQIVELPAGLDYHEWLASHTLAFFEHINLIYGTISEFCTLSGCPDMLGPGLRQYQWFDEKGKKCKVAAPQYIDYVMTFIQKTINDEAIFPTKYANEFPPSFESIAKKMHRLLFQSMAHLYHAHFKEIVLLGLHAHLNCTFAHFMLFNDTFHTVDEKETEVLHDLALALRLHPLNPLSPPITQSVISNPISDDSSDHSRTPEPVLRRVGLKEDSPSGIVSVHSSPGKAGTESPESNRRRRSKEHGKCSSGGSAGGERKNSDRRRVRSGGSLNNDVVVAPPIPTAPSVFITCGNGNATH